LKIAEQFPNTSAGERALLLAGSALFAQGKYQEAQAQLNKFVQAKPQSSFAPTAAYGVAAALEAQNKPDEALAAYQNLSVRYPSSSVLDDAKLAIARIQEAKNQPELALATYEEMLKPGGMGSATAEAVARKTALLAKHPELAKTNAPVISSSTVTGQTTVVTSPNSPAPAATNAVP
jgi:TolA-binding protein